MATVARRPQTIKDVGFDWPDGRSKVSKEVPVLGCPPRDAVDNHQATATASSARQGANMCKEDDRLRTLHNWPAKHIVDISTAAKNGFFYFGKGDLIRCQFCAVILGEWNHGDDIVADHRRNSPDCPLLQNKPTGNIPSNPATYDECGIYPSEKKKFSPVHPSYQLESSRLSSFANWPARMKQTPAALADAGFFYSGSGDQTICFSCGGGLKDWEDEDVPWEQHALWFESCPYLITLKGRNYIRDIKAREVVPETDEVSSVPPASPVVAAEPRTACDPTTPPKQTQEDSSKSCKICFVEERNTCFIPCGHLVACGKCALSVNMCPICREPYTRTIRVYFS